LKKYTAWKQEETKRENQDAVIIELQKGDKRFKDLLKAVNFTQTTLTSTLKELERSGLIETTKVEYKAVGYTLTKKGKRAFEEIFLLSDILDDIKSREGKYLSGGAPLQQVNTPPLFWPTMVHMAADKGISNILQFIPKEYLIQMQFDLINFIIENIKKKRIRLNEELEKQIVLAIQIDCSDLVKMLKNHSISGWKRLWKKEGGINTIWLQDSIYETKKPYVAKYKIKGV